MGDFTLARLAADRFLMIGSGVAERFHMRWFEADLPEHVQLRSRCADLLGFSIAGPRARDLLQAVANQDVAKEAFRFFTVREMDIGWSPAIVARVSFTGELGYEIYVSADHQLAVYEALVEAGRELGLTHFGGRALNALRLEKSFGGWLREYTPDHTPQEAGLDRFIDLDKGDFVGREAVRRQAGEAPARTLVTLVVEVGEGEGAADAWGDEPIDAEGRVVGFVTSGGYGHTVGKSLALAYLEPAFATPAAALAITILGEQRPARVVSEALHDPSGARMRS
jgi:dimethylglycine dehydrogenase